MMESLKDLTVRVMAAGTLFSASIASFNALYLSDAELVTYLVPAFLALAGFSYTIYPTEEEVKEYNESIRAYNKEQRELYKRRGEKCPKSALKNLRKN